MLAALAYINCTGLVVLTAVAVVSYLRIRDLEHKLGELLKTTERRSEGE